MTNQSDKTKLAKRAVKAAGWGYLGVAGKLLIQLGSQVFLARLLGPNEYGLFAIAAIVVGFSNFLSDAGVGSVLVQKENIDNDLIRFVSGWQWIFGGVVMTALCVSAPLVSEFFSEPRAIDIIRAMSLVCLLNAICSVPSNLLRRRLEFGSLQASQLGGFFFGYVIVGIPAAWYGAGVWSLVLAWVCQAAVTCVCVYFAARPSLRLKLCAPGGFEALRFGGGALVSNLSTWAGTNIDKIVVGRYFTTLELGLYNSINNLLSTAITQVLSTLQAVLFSATSRINSDRDALARSYLLLVEAGSLLFFPIFGCVAVVPELLLVGLYGPKWQAGAAVLPPIAFSMAVYGISGLITPLLWASGKVQEEGRIQLAGAAAIAISSVIAAQYTQLSGVAWAVFACMALRAFWTLSFAAKSLSLPLLRLLAQVVPGMVCTIFVMSSVFFFSRVMTSHWNVLPHWQLLAALSFGSITYVLAAFATILLIGSEGLKHLILENGIFKKKTRTKLIHE